MPYQPKENELIISCKSVVGGIANGLPFNMLQMTDTPIIVGIHDSNLWIEIEDVIGFSIDRNIVICLLNKIKDINPELVEKEMD